jgi:hypothetical protein
MSKIIVKTFAICVLVLFSTATKADSFFDVFFDVSIDEATHSPILNATGRVITPGSDVRKVDTEIVSLSRSSYRGHKKGFDYYQAVVHLKSSVTSPKGQRQTVDSFFDITYVCSLNSERENEQRCAVTGTKPIKKHEFRGHVTVLK